MNESIGHPQVTLKRSAQRINAVRVEWFGMVMETAIPEDATNEEVARIIERAFEGVHCAATVTVGQLEDQEPTPMKRHPGPPPRAEANGERARRWRREGR